MVKPSYSMQLTAFLLLVASIATTEYAHRCRLSLTALIPFRLLTLLCFILVIYVS